MDSMVDAKTPAIIPNTEDTLTVGAPHWPSVWHKNKHTLAPTPKQKLNVVENYLQMTTCRQSSYVKKRRSWTIKGFTERQQSITSARIKVCMTFNLTQTFGYPNIMLRFYFLTFCNVLIPVKLICFDHLVTPSRNLVFWNRNFLQH